LGVARVNLADEDHDLPALRQRLFDQLSRLPPGRNVVGTDVARALAFGRVTVLGQNQRLLSGIVNQLRLVVRIDRTDRNPVDAFGQQIVDDSFLFRGTAFTGNFHFGVDVRQFASGLFDSLARNGPVV